MWISKQDLKEIITQMSVHHFGKFREMTAGWIRACPRGSSSQYMGGLLLAPKCLQTFWKIALKWNSSAPAKKDLDHICVCGIKIIQYINSCKGTIFFY